jgi:hypothetical protein
VRERRMAQGIAILVVIFVLLILYVILSGNGAF